MPNPAKKTAAAAVSVARKALATLTTYAVKMAAINIETSLARAVNRSCARAGDEAYAVIREALRASGDIIPGGDTLTIRISLLSAPRRTRALAAVCLVGAATEIVAVCADADDCRPRHCSRNDRWPRRQDRSPTR